MNLKEQLLKEHSRNNTDYITRFIRNSPAKFKQIIDIIYNAEPPLPQRAAWLLATVNALHPELLTPYLAKFINTIKEFEVDAVRRNMMVVLASQTIPEDLQAKLIDTCFELIDLPHEKVVVKVHAMQTIANIAKIHPELTGELNLVIEEQLPHSSAAFKARARMIMKELNKL